MTIKLESSTNSFNTMVSSTANPAMLSDAARAVKADLPPRKTVEVKPPPVKKERTRIRKRVNTAEKRASHNAVERQRRETLNSKFLDLARLLPTLASLRRPSKSSIVNASIAHLNLQREQRLLASRELRALFSTNEELLAEINEWRGRDGIPAKTVAGWTETCEEIVSVENEVFGTFNEVGGQGDDEDEDGDGEMDGEASVSQDYQQQFSGMTNEVDDAAIMAAARSSFGSFSQPTPISAGSRQSAVDMQSAANAAFRSLPISSQSRISFASQASYPSQGYSDTSLNAQRAMNAFLADSYDQGSMHSVPSQHSPIGGGSIAGSNGDGIVTPPPMMIGDSRHAVTTFVDSPPSSGVAATSFSLAQNNGGDKVSDWAAQQVMLQMGPQSVGMDGCSPFEQPGNDARSYFQQHYPAHLFGNDTRKVSSPASISARRQNNLLPSAQQSLMVAQPHLAAAVFPPPTSASPPSSYLGSGDFYNSASMMGITAFEQGSPVNHQPQVNAHAATAAAAALAQQQIVQAASGLGLTKEQMEHWKRFATDSFLNSQAQAQAQHAQQQHPSMQRANSNHQHVPTMHELRDAVRAGMTVGMGLAWNGHDAVEGYA
jgi:hypothetical protein